MPSQTSPRSELIFSRGGFTIVEVMVAVLILMVGLLGMFQALNLAMDKNVENELRQKGVEAAEQQLSDLKARPFANITGNTSSCVTTTVGPIFKNISVERRVANLSSSGQTKQISVRVWWRYRGELYEHQTASGIGVSDGNSGQ